MVHQILEIKLLDPFFLFLLTPQTAPGVQYYTFLYQKCGAIKRRCTFIGFNMIESIWNEFWAKLPVWLCVNTKHSLPTKLSSVNTKILRKTILKNSTVIKLAKFHRVYFVKFQHQNTKVSHSRINFLFKGG